MWQTDTEGRVVVLGGRDNRYICVCARAYNVRRDRWPDICRSDTTETTRPRTGRRSTCARTSSPRDISWTTASTDTSGSTVLRAGAIWRSCRAPAAGTARAAAGASGWNDGSCSIGGRGPCRTITAGPTTPSPASPRRRRSRVHGRRSVFRYVRITVTLRHVRVTTAVYVITSNAGLKIVSNTTPSIV